MPLRPSRRDLILSAVAAAVASGAPAAPALAASPLDLDAFLALSATLTGTPAKDLDRDAASALLAGFAATGNGPALAALAADPAADADVADALVAAWYSGVYDTGKGEAVATYNGALVWNALTFTKPQGNCGGELGYWSQPPAT